MNYSLLTIEILVTLLGLGVLLADLWVPASLRRLIGYGAATMAGIILTYAIGGAAPEDGTAFGGMFVVDAMSNLFKGLFLLAAVVVLLLSLDWSEKLVGYAEYCALTLFALVGMLFAASANDFILMFVALELITITFYILVSFQRNKAGSIEAGVKYLILGAVASGFMVFGAALIFGAANTTNFFLIAAKQMELAKSPLFLTGLLLTVVGLGFKIAAFPFQMWAPDVYQGAPAPTVAFLATGSKAAGFVLLLRIAFGVVPELTAQWSKLFLGFGGGDDPLRQPVRHPAAQREAHHGLQLDCQRGLSPARHRGGEPERFRCRDDLPRRLCLHRADGLRRDQRGGGSHRQR